jgi:hypothetical protein
VGRELTTTIVFFATTIVGPTTKWCYFCGVDWNLVFSFLAIIIIIIIILSPPPKKKEKEIFKKKLGGNFCLSSENLTLF